MLLSPQNVLHSPDTIKSFNKRLNSHRTFWNGRIMDATQTELERRQGSETLTPDDIIDAKLLTARAFQQELTAVIHDMESSHALESQQPVHIIRRGASIIGLSMLYRRILSPSPETSEPVREVEAAAVGDANVLSDIIRDDRNQIQGYALHVDATAVAGHFAEEALPFMFSENWCVLRGLYLHCLSPAKPELPLQNSDRVKNAGIDFDSMITIYPHPSFISGQS